jgi:O-antigen ligase
VRLRRAQLALLTALAATAPLSIFASQLLLALSLAVLAARLMLRSTRLPRTAVDAPLLAFAVWTLLSASFASNPAEAHQDAKKLVLFAVFYVAVEVMPAGEDRRRVLAGMNLGGIALAFLMVLEHHFLGFDQLNRRPHGFLGHYMSAAGVLIVVLLVSAADLSRAQRLPRLRELWLAGAVMLPVAAVAAFSAAGVLGQLPTRLCVAAAGILAATMALSLSERVRAAAEALRFVAVPLAGWALVVSQTRSAWLGALAGLAVVVLVRMPRLLALGAAAAGLALLLQPSLRQRLTVSDASSVDRYYMWQAGIDMVLDRPLFGQGPGMIIETYPRYRWPEAPNPLAPHLHNNFMQVAAERGLPGLAFFAWWTVLAFVVALRAARAAAATRDEAAGATLGALAVLVAVSVAGLFEYNLGDSEVLMLVLLVQAVPFAFAAGRAPQAAAA